MAKQSEGHSKDKPQNEINEKVLHINRCSKVVKGGRKFSFSAFILVWDANGRIGYGFGKANELTDAIRKGGDAAKKALKSYPKHGTTIPHEVLVHSDGATVLLKPACDGSGLIAGPLVRSILEMAGYKDVVAKSIGGNNPINQVKATVKALDSLMSREAILQSRGQSI